MAGKAARVAVGRRERPIPQRLQNGFFDENAPSQHRNGVFKEEQDV